MRNTLLLAGSIALTILCWGTYGPVVQWGQQGMSTVAGQVDRHAAGHFGSALLQARLYRALGRTEAWRSALARARALAGERSIPDDIASPPPEAGIGR